MSAPESLKSFLQKKPLVLVTLGEKYRDAIEAKGEVSDKLTIAVPHEELKGIRPPVLCFIQIPASKGTAVLVGVIQNKMAVTDFETRISFSHLHSLTVQTLESLESLLSLGQSHQLKRKLGASTVARLGPQLGIEIIGRLFANPIDQAAIEDAAEGISAFDNYSIRQWEQRDAIRTALATFGISRTAKPSDSRVTTDSDSSLEKYTRSKGRPSEALDVNVLEDSVIDHDATMIPGLSLIEKDLTGRAVFENSREKLVVYTANKKPLEEMLGVDLIYINELVGSSIMVQYKMLNREKDDDNANADWIYRPDDQFEKEVSRMQMPQSDVPLDDYRIHADPFFFKFVKRKGNGKAHGNFIVSLPHLKHLLESSACRGPKNGLRIGFESLGGVYLRETEFLGLIRCGYIGLHRKVTKAMSPLIKAVADGDRALVLAWQSRIEGITG